MKLDAELMFECLMYLNVYYYPILSIINAIMAVAKALRGDPRLTEEITVSFTAIFGELAKILLYNRYKNTRRDLITAVAVLFTYVTIGSVIYTFFFAIEPTPSECIIGAMTILLTTTEVVFGTLQIMPCIHKVEYY